MRILIATMGLMMLAGCANVADIRKNPPVLSLSSDKSAELTAECIRDGWQSTSLIGGSVGGVLQKSGAGISVIAPNPESPWHLVDVVPSGLTNSKVYYRFYRTWQSPSDKVINVVKACSD